MFLINSCQLIKIKIYFGIISYFNKTLKEKKALVEYNVQVQCLIPDWFARCTSVDVVIERFNFCRKFMPNKTVFSYTILKLIVGA